MHGIQTIDDLLGNFDEINGISEKLMQSLMTQRVTAHVRKAPDNLFVDHKLQDNPYLSRYGSEWEIEIAKVSMMSSYVCVTEMVMHIYEKSADIMKDTKYKDNWLFYHDALTLMKVEDCKDWMKGKGIFKHWILPMNDLNKGTSYYGHPIRNSPELMPLDCSLFCDLKRSVQYHILLTNKLNDAVDKDKKFSISTIN